MTNASYKVRHAAKPNISGPPEKIMNNLKTVFTRISVLSLTIAALAVFGFGQVGYNSKLHGTYRLDSGRSDNVSAIVSSVSRSNRMTNAQRQTLENQLTAPDTITLRTVSNDRNSVAISTSNTAETTLRVNGGSQSVVQNDGSRANVTATMRNNVLRLSRVGGGTSYTITFASDDNGSGLQVTRMITTNYLDRTVYADSYYTRSDYSSNYPASGGDDEPYNRDDNVPYTNDDDTGYSSSDPNDAGYSRTNPGTSPGRDYPKTRTVSGRYIVPAGVVLSGTLDNKITTKASQENDRFTMTIDSPYEFRGAELEGYLSDVKRAGRVTGTSRLTFNFETIRLRSGEVYDFVGVLESVTDSTGKIIKVGDEGDAKGDSKTKESIKRGGIGAGVGAILGGIIGGAKGAIIGATIGGGAGAGSVAIQGRDDIELLEGSTITVESTSPNLR